MLLTEIIDPYEVCVALLVGGLLFLILLLAQAEYEYRAK